MILTLTKKLKSNRRQIIKSEFSHYSNTYLSNIGHTDHRINKSAKKIQHSFHLKYLWIYNIADRR